MKTFSSFFKTLTLILILLATSVNAHAWGSVHYESTSPTTIYPGDKVEVQMLLNGTANGASYKRFGYGTTNSKAGLTWSEQWNYIEQAGNDHRWKFYFTPTSAATYYWSLWIGWGSSVGDNGRYYKTGEWNEGSGSYQSASVTVSAVPKVNAFTATAQSTSSIALSWTKNSLNDDVLIVQGSSTAPTQGTSYSNGSTIGTGKVVYKGNATSTTITGLSASTSYTFYIYSIHNSKYYSASTSASATTKTPTNSLTVKAGTGIESVTGSTDPVTLNSSYPITATPKTGYTFSTWTADPSANATFANATSANTNVTVKNGAVTVTATATENTHDVTVSYKYGSTTIKDNTTTTAVGEANAKSITAPPITGYTFKEWTLGDGITNKSANTTTNPINITTKASGEWTLTANYAKETCVYFVNTSNWNDVYVYAWNGNGETKNAGWPGEAMTKTDEKIGGFDVYKYCSPFDNLIFNNNNSGAQTGNLVWEDGSYYELGVHGNFSGEWKTTYFTSVSDNGTSASLTLNINAGNYEFGMKVPDWKSCNNISFTRNANSHSMTQNCGNNNNATFNADVNGEYTFTWTFATNTLTITYPTLSSYTVIFNKNANDATGTMANQSFNYDEAQALSPNGFTRNGYAFIGWSTASNGDVEYADEATVTNLDAANIGTVTLYAQWLSQTPTYTINFDKQNGENGTNSATVQYQNNNYSVNPVVAPTRTDYTFGGYYTEAEGAGVQVVSAAGEWLKSVTGYTDASGNWIKNSNVTTLYAKWISNGTATEGLPTGVYLVGEVFNNWSAAPNQEFKKATESSTTYSLVATLAGGKEYKFKVIDNGNWKGNSIESEFLTETNTSVILYKDGANNAECKITTTEAGEYIFTWDSETNTLSVEYPSDRVTVTFFGDGGTVGAVADDRVLTSPAKVKPGTSVTFTATPDANNAFSQWKKNGVVVSTDLTYTCAIDADATIEAVFLKPTTVFLKPHDAWKSSNARFAIYYWNDKGNGWVNMKQLTCRDEYYTADVPVGYSQLQFVRMNPDNKENQFKEGVSWNQTTDLTLPTNGNNLYDLTKIYLKPNAQWKSDGARFAAYFFNDNSNNEWMSMLPTSENGVYYCDVPTTHLYNKVLFVRMPMNNPDNNWDINLNESKDIDLYNGSNYYTLQENKWGKNNEGEKDDLMDIYYSGKWTKLELPTITITNTTPDFGDVLVKTTGGRIITNGEKVPFDTKVIVTFMPKNGYTCKTATINGGSLSEGEQYTICNNTTINVTFAIKEEWYVIGVDGDWETPQERFRFVDGQLEVELDTNITANFKIAYMQGTEILKCYGNQAFSISNKSHNLTEVDKDNGAKCTIATTYYGKYIFTWDAVNMKLTITYPLSVGDYRLAYQDSEDGSFHPERVIKKCIIGDRLDTVSFFVRHDKQPKLVLQQCATLVDGVGTWQTIDDNIEFHVGKTGVWNFVLQQTNNPTHRVQVLTDDIKPYEGDYYIRTKSAKDGWTYFRSDSHKMTYSSYADNNEPFSHYFCKWVSTEAEAANKTNNVRYTIANDYGDCISDTLAADPTTANPRIVENEYGYLPTNGANVRFGWDWETNEIRRAYIAGSTNETAETFLRLADAEYLKNSSKEVVTGIKFEDLQNWIYQVDVIATKNTKVKLTALYANNLQYFKGGVDNNDKINLLASDAADMEFDIRLTYDFKTNHLIVAWVPNNNGTYDGTLGANMMVIREHDYKNEEGTVAVTQLNLQNEGLTDVDTVYAVMTFTQNWINKEPRTRDQSIYWVSFPFDVKLSDAFGFGEYADAWIIQYYDGAARAEKGLFSDSGTYWKYIFNPDGVVLKKGVGYVLVLDLDKIQFNHGVTSVSLYFPSSGEVGTITRDISATVTVPAHKCEITTGSINHTITDSHWNLIGIPAFKDVTEFNTDKTLAPVYQQDSVSFYYEFLPNKSTYRANNNVTDFKAMYSYMVQFAGTINWNTKEAIKPAELAARRNSESELPEKISFRLEIAQDDVMADQTFVQLQQEGATADFDMNLDLTKIINSGANIYTLAGEQRIQSAGNALPMGEAIVPVGVQIATEGEYIFRMPDGTEGMVVELIDYETNTRTNLLLSDYIVTLPKGTEENRFALHIQPEKDVTTGVGNVGDEAKGIEKYLIDGKLIIRTAEGIFDAQGHRL